MSQKSKLIISKENWKKKAMNRGDEARYLRRENKRIKQERNRLKQQVQQAKKNKELEQMKTPAVQGKVDLVFIALQLFLGARIGFRAVSRVLGVLQNRLGLQKAPCTQTIINWVQRLSLTRIRNADDLLGSSLLNDYIWIIDASIALGSGKILTVLALKADRHRLNTGPPTLQDVHCIAVRVSASLTGEAIAEFLLKVIQALGRPLALLKDGGTDLAKSLKILDQRGYNIPSIADVSHVVANLLKHAYADHPMFDTFLSSCGKASAKLKQTVLACLAPPKVSTKARFMNLHRLVTWAENLLKHSPAGRATKDSLLAKLRESMDNLPACKLFIQRFQREASILLECQSILKNRGLSNQTVKEYESRLEDLSPYSQIRTGFVNWMRNQLETAEKLGLSEIGLPISSDSIESLFKIAKAHGTGEVKDANRIAGRIPAMCGQVTKEDARKVLQVNCAQQQELMGNLSSLIRQRRQILPNPGCLEDLNKDTNHDIELIPRSKNRSKNIENKAISDDYTKRPGPTSGQGSQLTCCADTS